MFGVDPQTLRGPDDTPYAGGIFQVDIIIPSDYPFSPPKMKFITKGAESLKACVAGLFGSLANTPCRPSLYFQSTSPSTRYCCDSQYSNYSK